MDLAFWQKRARIVAYVDLVLTTMKLLITILLIVFGVAVVKYKDEIQQQLAEQDFPENSVNVVLWALWILTAVMTVNVAIEVRAAIMLFKATKTGTEPRLALYGARIWRNADVVFPSHYIVCKFILALEQANETIVYASHESVKVQK